MFGIPPPPPGMLEPPPGSMTIKKKIETKYKLPNLNWTSLKPGQVRGTVFSELDDEKYFKVTPLLLLRSHLARDL